MREAKAATDAVKTGVKVAERLVRKAWSVLEAASEKERPSEYLSSDGIRSIQGKPKQG